MHRLRYLLLPAVAFAAAVGLLGAADSAAPSALPDPVPIRRLVLPPDQLDQQLRRDGDGLFEKMPRGDFESLVQKAARVKSQPTPRLIEARYQARLEGDGLVGGGQWKVAHTGDGPGLLNLGQPQAINLALRHVRFENGDALVGDFDGRHPALLLDRPGEHRIALEWSARGEARPEGLQLELRIPACPVAVLEVDVPADRVIAPLNGLLLSGPLPAESAERRHWQITCGGRTVVRFLVRRADPPPGAPPALRLVRRTTVQKVYPEGVEATYKLDLEVAPYGVRELVCSCDPQLRPREVILPYLESWTIQPGPQPDARSQLVIRLRQPLREGILQVSCLAPLGSPADSGGNVRSLTWHSPSLRLEGGVPRGETLEVWLHPDLRMEDWQSGGFRLTGSVSEVDPDRKVRMQHLTLEGGGVQRAPGQPAGVNRPTARFQAGGAQFRARELAWWRIDGSGMQLTLQIAFEVRHGRLFQLPVELPSGWQVERVELSAPALLRNTSVRPPRGKERATLLVDLARPLEPPAPPESASGRLRPRPLTQPSTIDSDLAAPPSAISQGRPTLTIALRPSQPFPAGGASLPFPDAVPVGALFREGVLAIDVDEQVYRATVKTKAASMEVEEEGPWGPQPPDHYFRYFGRPVAGTLQLEPRPARIRARCQNEVFVASGGAYSEMRLELEAEVGSPDTIDLYISAPGLNPQLWRDGRGEQGGTAPGPVREAVRLPAGEAAPYLQVLGSASPLQAAALLAACPGGELWRLRLSRPLRAREPLHLHTTRSLVSHDERWLIPLPAVLGAHRMEGEVTLHLAGADLVQLEAVGLRETAAEVRGATPAWRTFRYSQPRASLMLVGQTLAGGRPTEAVLDAARLTTYVSADGTLQHHFSFQAANWPQRTLPLPLPSGARPLAIGVDGRWLPRLVGAREKSDGESDAIELPVPQGSTPGTEGVHRFEIVTTSTAQEGLLWRRARAPLPALPVAPLHLQRRWRLPPELVPLFEGRYLRLPGSGERFAPARRQRRLTDFFRLAPDLPGPWQASSQEAEQQQLLAEAALSLQNTRGGQKITLRELVEAVAFKYLQDRQALVVDSRAVHEAGLSVASEVTVRPRGSEARLPWEECGLTALATPAAILLTSHRQRDAWLGQAGLERSAALSASVQQTLAAAVDHGQDPSARFQSALVWLGHDRVQGAGAAGEAPALIGTGLDAAAWSEWEAIPGQADDELILVSAQQGSTVGLVLTGLFCLLLWRLGGRSGRARFLLLFGTLASAGLALPWLPLSLQEAAWWPFLASVLAGLWWYLRWVSRRRHRVSGSVRRAAGAAVAGAGLVLLVATARTDPAAGPAPVYLLPGAADARGKQMALVPAELLSRLRALARPVASEARAVLLSAHYDGKPVQDVAEWSAVFGVHCVGEEAVSLALPLDGVQLVGDVLLDGASVPPRALPASAPQPGYALEVRGSGAHKVELRFRVPIASSGEDRSLQLSVPPLLQSHLTWHLPAAASYPRALVKQGVQWEAAEPGGKRFEVDLGRITAPLQLAWHERVPPARVPQLQLKSAYLWDLGVAASTLTALLSYSIQDGSVSELAVKLPPELEVHSADAYRPLAPAARPAAGVSGVYLRDWKVVSEQGVRWLRLELPYPVTGEVQVLLELVPVRPLPAEVTLPLPEPQGRPLPEQQFLAYRTGPGLSAHLQGVEGLSGIHVERFAPFWSSAPHREKPLDYACTIRQEPRLRLQLARQAPHMQAAQEVTLRVGARLAEIQAVLDLSLPEGEGVGLVEWDLVSGPPVTVANVAGTGLSGWKQTGGRVLVWLDQMRRDVKLEMSAWMPLAEPARGQETTFDLPCLRVRGAQAQTTRVHLIAQEGLALKPLQLHQLQPLGPAGGARAALDQRLTTTKTSYGGRFQVRRATVQAAPRILTFAELRERRLAFTAVAQFPGPQSELRRLHVRLRGWEGKNVELQVEGAGVVQRHERQRAPGEYLWDLDLEPRSGKSLRLTLTGSMAVEQAGAGMVMPDVDVLDGLPGERWLAVVGRELTADARGALERQGAQALGTWPGVAERLQRGPAEVWKVGGPEWQLRLVPSDRGARAAPVRVFMQEHTLAVIDGRHWLHEVVYWLHHESHTDLSLLLPARARVVAVSVDGVAMTPLQPQPVHLWLPLPGRPGVRCVTLRWLYESSEPLAQPNLECPRIEGALPGVTLGTVLTPPGWEVLGGEKAIWLGTGDVRAATLNLYRAEAQLQMCRALGTSVQDGSAALVEARERFDQCWEQAEQALAMGGRLAEQLGPRGEALGRWLRRLRADKEALPGKKGAAAGAEGVFPGEALLAEEPSRLAGLQRSAGARPGDDLWQYGTPLSWQVGSTEAVPRVHLRSLREQRTRQAVFVSGLWLAGLLLVALVVLFPFGKTLLRLLWPEQVLLLALLGWWVAGPTLIVLLLLLLSVYGRIVQVVRSVRTTFRRRAARTELAHNLLGSEK